MSPLADWMSLRLRSLALRDVLIPLSMDTKGHLGANMISVVTYASQVLADFDKAYEKWGPSRHDSSLSMIVPPAFGSASAYETAQDNIRSAHETIMLALATQQR
jgi:hypothetical protein